MQSYTKMRSTRHHDVVMKVIPGHFVTPNSHINYYIDMTTMKTRQNEAVAAAKAMSEKLCVEYGCGYNCMHGRHGSNRCLYGG